MKLYNDLQELLHALRPLVRAYIVAEVENALTRDHEVGNLGVVIRGEDLHNAYRVFRKYEKYSPQDPTELIEQVIAEGCVPSSEYPLDECCRWALLELLNTIKQ